jgi:hypothetical protein
MDIKDLSMSLYYDLPEDEIVKNLRYLGTNELLHFILPNLNNLVANILGKVALDSS